MTIALFIASAINYWKVQTIQNKQYGYGFWICVKIMQVISNILGITYL